MPAAPSHRSQEVDVPRRGDIYLVNFESAPGSEIKKTGHALIIQNNASNEHSPITIVAAITSKFGIPAYPIEVVMEAAESGLAQRSAVLLNQIRSVDRRRLVRRIGRADEKVMRRVGRAIEISLGLFEVE